MADKIKNLIKTTYKLISFLESYDQKYWANWFKDAVKDIENEDFDGIEKILNASGGMGSFNDLYFCPQNGDKIEEKDVEKVNNLKNKLFSDICELADAIRRSYYLDK